MLRGKGGVQGQNFRFEICCSPTYLVSKMGSLSSQLNLVAEIWPLQDGTYFVFLTLNIGKNAKIWFQNFVCEWYFGPPDAPKDPILVFLEDFMNIYDSTEGFFAP